MKSQLVGILLLILASPGVADVKLTNRMTAGGQDLTGIVYMKDGKVRNEVTFAKGTLVGIQDCQHRQVISMNDRSKTYLVTDVDDRMLTEREAHSSLAAIVTVNLNEQDTGERKKFFGYTAHHIKGTLNARGGEGACRVESNASVDGWYIDLPDYASCSPAERQIFRERLLSISDACKLRIAVNASGIEQPGYPVLVDMTFGDGKGGESTVHQETTSLSMVTLDPNLFEIPTGYTRVQSYRDLLGSSATADIIAQQSTGPNFPAVTNGGPNENANGVVAGESRATTEKKSTPKIGIAQITASADQALATDGLQQELANDINFLGGRAVIIAADPSDRDAVDEQARQQSCDYVIFTNITNYRTATVGQKLGRVFNRGGLGGVGGTDQGRVQIDAEVKLYQPDKQTPVLDGSVNFRQNDPEATAKGLMHTEARTVMLQLKQLQAAK